VAELYEGLDARSQNRWPSLAFDALGINDLLSPFLTAGFYYKTFMWPRAFWEKLYEPAIRRAAGLGSLSREADPDLYDKGFPPLRPPGDRPGPRGPSWPRSTAGRAGAASILADEDLSAGAASTPNGRSAAARHAGPPPAWPSSRPCPTSAHAAHHVMGVFDTASSPRGARRTTSPCPAGKPASPLARLRPRAVLAAGALERPIAFRDNDRPGVMLAAPCAPTQPLGRAAGRASRSSSTTRTACAPPATSTAPGVDVVAVIGRAARTAARLPGIRHLKGAVVTGTTGRLALAGITARTAQGREESIACDVLVVSGGWNPRWR
jgi:sarcosine oxidase subunit alpha